MPSNAISTLRHLAIIMDGNRRWAQQRGLPSAAGHLAGVYAIRTMVRECSDRGIEFLTLFAFSTENWKRSSFEVACLMDLLRKYLISDVPDMQQRGVRFRMVGDRTRLDPGIQNLLAFAESATRNNQKVHLTLAINYGGRWDMLQAAQAWQAAHSGESLEALEEADLSAYLSTAFAPGDSWSMNSRLSSPPFHALPVTSFPRSSTARSMVRCQRRASGAFAAFSFTRTYTGGFVSA